MSKLTNGTWGHSSATGGNSYVIFSVDRDNLSTVELQGRRQALIARMNDRKIGYKPLVGSWEGKTEQAFIINLDRLRDVWDLVKASEQDAVLVLGPCDARDRRPATIHTVAETNSYYLGLFQSVTEKTAKTFPGWTYDPSTGEFFAVLDAPLNTSPEYRNAIDLPAYLKSQRENDPSTPYDRRFEHPFFTAW